MSPGSKGRVVVALSGGVDSSVAACLLHEQGYEIVGLFMRTGVAPADPATCDPSIDSPAAPEERQRGCCSAADAADARLVAGRLNAPFFALNFKRQFDAIMDYFADEYLQGRTPNPCVLCNEQLKFGRLVEYGQAIGADYVATGHYARVELHQGSYHLLRAVDRVKDQSYVLFGVDREALPRVLFPIGGMTKAEVREQARRLGLPVHAKRESQDICFVPDRDYARVVRERRPESFIEGPILDRQGREIGRHPGIAHFTIGQRRGLGVAMGQPVYVVSIDVGRHSVVLGPKEDLSRRTLVAARVRWLVDAPREALRAEVQIRYSHAAAPATVELLPGECVRVTFDTPQLAITPGQAAVFYQGDRVLGGGWIEHEVQAEK